MGRNHARSWDLNHLCNVVSKCIVCGYNTTGSKMMKYVSEACEEANSSCV